MFINALPAVVKHAFVDRHRFSIGQAVRFESRWTRGIFQITALLPERDSEPAYTIKSAAEDCSRIAAESELSPA